MSGFFNCRRPAYFVLIVWQFIQSLWCSIFYFYINSVCCKYKKKTVEMKGNEQFKKKLLRSERRGAEQNVMNCVCVRTWTHIIFYQNRKKLHNEKIEEENKTNTKSNWYDEYAAKKDLQCFFFKVNKSIESKVMCSKRGANIHNIFKNALYLLACETHDSTLKNGIQNHIV